MNYVILGIFLILTNIMLVVAVSMKEVHSRTKNSVTVQNIPLETFDRTVNLSDRSGILVGPKTPIYLLRSKSLNFNQNNIGKKKRNRRYIKEKVISIPDIVYPEILIIVDYHLYKNYNRRTIIPYLLSFWDKVDSIFSSLNNPKFKFSIAGIVIAQDNSVFESFIPSKSSEIDYKAAKKNMKSWLSRARKSIPFESYDTYVIMTRTRDKKSGNKQVLGISGIQTACATPESNRDVGGIILTPGGEQGTRTAGHELGHIFGAEHDKPDCGKSYLMATYDGYPTDWSQCSINSFHESFKQQNWTCLYNKPDHTKVNNPGVYETFESFEREIENKDFFTVLMDDEKETFNLNEFTLLKKIIVYYVDGTLTIGQGGSTSALKIIKPKELQYRIPDYRKLTLNPKEVDPLKEINIYHEDDSIYVYQGSKPINITQNQPPPILDVSYTDDYQLKFTDDDFDPEKLVLIYYRDNKLHVTQKNIPKNEHLFDKKYWKDLSYVGSDRTIIFLYPMTTITNYGLTIKHHDDLIYIYQFKEPGLSGREYEPYTVRYLPDLKYSETDVEKIVDFKDSFETKITRKINTSDLNSKKLMLIGFKNGRVIIKQITTSFEEDQNVSSDYKNLQIITADRNTILVHLSKIPKRNEIQIRHDDGKIFVWQGSDQIPELNIDRPDIVEILNSDYFDYIDYFN